MTARFKTLAKADRVKSEPCTVLIDRGRGVVSVRPLRRRRMFTLPLATVAEMIVARVVKAEALAARTEKSKRQVKRGLRR